MRLKDYIFARGVGAYLALVFSALSILLTVILVQIIGMTASKQVEANIGHGLAELALQTSDKLDRGMFERYREVKLMTQRAGLTGPDASADQRRGILEALQETYPYYAWIGLADTSGKVLVSAQKMLEGADVSQRPWFQNALKGIHLGDVHEAKLLAKLIPAPADEPMRFVDVAFPYTDKHGKTIGVLGTHLSWHWAREVEQSIIEPIAARRKLESLIVGSDGTVLLGPPGMQGKTISAASFRTAQDKTSGFLIEDWPDNKKYLVGFSKSKGYASYPGLGWTVLVRQNVDDAFLPVRNIQRRVLWSGVVLAALFSVLGLIAARRITRPLWALARSAQRIQKGEAAEIPTSRTGYFEVKALTGSFSAMVSDLLQKEAALKELNLTLENRVAQRTREMEQALANVSSSEKRIQAIIDAAQDAFIGVDLHGNITDWNAQAERMFGWSWEEAVGRPLSAMVLPARYQAAYAETLRTFKETGKTDLVNRRIERTVIDRNGTEFPVEITVSLAGTHETYFFSAFLHDISDRKKVERIKNEFISTVSHELRTPLTSIRGSLGLLAGGAAGTIPAPAKSLLDIANANCDRLVRLINDMLDIEKIESGNMHFEPVTQAVLPLVEHAIAATQGYAANFKVPLQLQADAADVQVAVDRDRMIQVLVNLLSNAVKFSPPGAAVLVKVSSLSDRVRLSVLDRGNGIPADFRERIFQKFAQADATDARQKGGTGLGLNICKSIVEQHGGHIDFYSEAGKGTEFYVDLPMVTQTTNVQQNADSGKEAL
jgi:PAS domain S-box-containing protein